MLLVRHVDGNEDENNYGDDDDYFDRDDSSDDDHDDDNDDDDVAGALPMRLPFGERVGGHCDLLHRWHPCAAASIDEELPTSQRQEEDQRGHRAGRSTLYAVQTGGSFMLCGRLFGAFR